ncbi:MAG: RNA polymerase sigma factor [Candidatus Hydrogenedentes bacterium]|nr:RNA polymerase sigma factor [Candidatus Hydrogenedentota bacterium]
MDSVFIDDSGFFGWRFPAGVPGGAAAVVRVFRWQQDEAPALTHAAHGTKVYDSAMEFDEQESLRLALQGDGEAFACLVDHYMPRIYSHVYRMLRRREDAEDVTQEAFVRAWRFLHRYDAGRPFRNWLYTIASNLALNQLRLRQRRGDTISIEEPVELPSVEEAATARIARGEHQRRIDAALAQLSPTAAALIQLHYQEGLAIREAAEILGMNENAAKVALHRARKALREILVEEDNHE